MVRINIYILGISELKWMGMCEFNSDDHYIYYCGQESHRRNRVALIINKKVWNAVLGCNLTTTEVQYLGAVLVCFQGEPFNITVIQVYALTTNAQEARLDQFYEDLEDLLELIWKKDVHWGLACKSRKSRDTLSNRQVCPWRTKWSRAKANQILSRECTSHSKYPFSATQEMILHMDITEWSIPKSNW